MSRTLHRVDVALPLPIHRTFTYQVEGAMPAPGTRVLVPFRRDERIGWVVGPGSQGAITGLKSVLAVLDETPTVPPDLIDLCRWMADYYVAPLGIALRVAVPAVLSDVSRDYVTLVAARGHSLRPREQRIVSWLTEREGPQRVRTLRRALAMGSVWPEIGSLSLRGVITHETVPPAEPSVRMRRVVRIIRQLGTLAEREEVFGRAGRQSEAYGSLEASGGSAELRHLTEN